MSRERLKTLGPSEIRKYQENLKTSWNDCLVPINPL